MIKGQELCLKRLIIIDINGNVIKQIISIQNVRI